MINSGPVLYLIYLIFATKKKFIVQKISAFGGTRAGNGLLCDEVVKKSI